LESGVFDKTQWLLCMISAQLLRLEMTIGRAP
jgi:hypothetical protein